MYMYTEQLLYISLLVVPLHRIVNEISRSKTQNCLRRFTAVKVWARIGRRGKSVKCNVNLVLLSFFRVLGTLFVLWSGVKTCGISSQANGLHQHRNERETLLRHTWRPPSSPQLVQSFSVRTWKLQDPGCRGLCCYCFNWANHVHIRWSPHWAVLRIPHEQAFVGGHWKSLPVYIMHAHPL